MTEREQESKQNEEFTILRLADSGHREEVDECVRVLRAGGFGVLPIPVRGLAKPEVRFKGRDYRGLNEIRKLVEPSDDPEIAQ